MSGVSLGEPRRPPGCRLNTLDSLGYACHLGHHPQAATYYQQSLALADVLGNSYHTATVLDHLGDNCHAAGDPAAARGAWQQALDILDQRGHCILGPSPGWPDASQIRAKLRQIDGPD